MTPGDARAIAKEAYVYGFPLVDNYRVNHSYFVDRSSPEFKAPWNEINNTARVFTPDDKAIQTANSDTPYSQLGTDLRAEPLVLTTPPVEKNRDCSVQLIDAYTHNCDYIGTRAAGNRGGNYLLAGPGWNGEAPTAASRSTSSTSRPAPGRSRTGCPRRTARSSWSCASTCRRRRRSPVHGSGQNPRELQSREASE